MNDIINVLTGILANYGFPAAICILLIYDGREREKQHTLQIDKILKVVNENTRAFQSFIKGGEK